MTDIPDYAYAIIFKGNQEVELVMPPNGEGHMTDGQMLLIGILNLLKQPGWANKVIEDTAESLMEHT